MSNLHTWYWGSENNCNDSHYKVRLGYYINSQSIEGNTSNVTLKLQVKSTSSSYKTYGYNQTTRIDGTSLSTKSFDMRNTNVWQDFGSRTITITHNADGTKSVGKSGSFTTTATGTYSLKSGSASVTVDLPTIPRASQPSCITYPNTTQNVGNIGNTITIHMNRVSGSFLHHVYAKWANKTVEIGSNIAYNVEWTIPMDFCNDIGNTTAGYGTIYVDTYSNGTYVGTKTVGFTATVPDWVNPSINSISITEANQNVGLNVFVQNKSQLRVITNAGGAYGSWITGYRITGIDNNTYYSNDFITSPLLVSGVRRITITVTDSRGRTATTTRDYSCVAYSNPIISEVSALRCNIDGTLNEDGIYLKYIFKGSVSPINNLNAKFYKLGYKTSSETNYTYITISNDSYTVNLENVVITDIIFSEDSSYDIQFVIEDRYMSVAQNVSVPTGFTLIDFNASGKAMAVGKVSEAESNEELFEVALPTKLEKIIELLFKEDGWADKFAIKADFSGADDSNLLKIMGAVGGQGINAELYDLLTISGKNGNVSIKGDINLNRAKKISFGSGEIVGNSEYGDMTIKAIGGWIYMQPNGTTQNQFIFRSDGVLVMPNGDAQAKPTLLYDNWNGTNGTVNLSQDRSNFDRIVIYYRNDDWQIGSTEIKSADITTYGTIIRKNINNIRLLISSALFLLSGNVITINRNSQAQIEFGGSSYNDENQIYIQSVYGYK